jgi:hypothetical protein
LFYKVVSHHTIVCILLRNLKLLQPKPLLTSSTDMGMGNTDKDIRSHILVLKELLPLILLKMENQKMGNQKTDGQIRIQSRVFQIQNQTVSQIQNQMVSQIQNQMVSQIQNQMVSQIHQIYDFHPLLKSSFINKSLTISPYAGQTWRAWAFVLNKRNPVGSFYKTNLSSNRHLGVCLSSLRYVLHEISPSI